MMSSITLSSFGFDMNFNKTQAISVHKGGQEVKDKSEATSQILGYGVDSEGFFTSDFNAKAQIPQSFKIHSQQIKDLHSTYTSYTPAYKSIDIAQTVGNAYKAFEKEMTNLKQDYNQEEFVDLISSNHRLKSKFSDINALQNELDERKMSAENIDFAGFLNPNLLTPYTQNERIDKTALLAMYVDADFIEGEVNMYGKIMGFDKNMSKAELENLHDFINEHKIFGLFGVGANISGFENVMHSTNLSLDEFKQKYLEFKEKIEEKQGFFNGNLHSQFQENAQTSENQDKISKRIPIQVISKSQTYKDLNFSSIQNLLKDKHKIQMFELLFSQKNDKTNHSSKDFMNFNVKQFNQMKNLNSLDIKA